MAITAGSGLQVMAVATPDEYARDPTRWCRAHGFT